jgi:RNA polymerase sigma factor (sigma-70 family)
MLKLRAIAPAPKHEEVFLQRYQWLRSQALQLTGHDAQRAEDLVHDAFIQFTLNRPDLQPIQNLDGYLYRMLRNLHLSSVRRASLVQLLPLSILDYDSAEVGLRTVDVQARLQTQEDLRRICYYACLRRATSKVGSVLILRFFHGYYPGEIAQILRIQRSAVEAALRVARGEAKLYLNDPDRLRLITEHQPAHPAGSGGVMAEDFLCELRESIFRSCSSVCLPVAQLRRLYRAAELKAPETIDCNTLAHLVSCPRCLDEVNRLLGLATLAERSPEGTIGKDTRPKGGSGGPPSDGVSGSGSVDEFKRKSRRRLRDVFEHRPQELLVSVNGFVLGSQEVGAKVNKQTISIKGEEKIGFIEIFSEQGMRLSFLDVEPPTDGAIEQRTRAEFSEGRTLELALDFGGPWPTLRVTYRDPSLNQVRSSETEVQSLSNEIQDQPPQIRALLANVVKRWIDFGLRTPNFGLLLRPGAVAVVLSLLLIAALFLLKLPTAPASAAELLKKSVAADEALAARPDQVLHHTISLEEKTTAGVLMARRKIEVWRSGERRVTARRLYDDRGTLIAGDWRRADGTQTMYRRGLRPQLQLPSEKHDGAALTFDNVWQIGPSAKEFTALIGRADDARVEERNSDYVISYGDAASAGARGLLKATLVLNRADLHPIEQTLVVQQGSELREYHFTETSFERHAPNSVALAVFEPEPELIRSDGETQRRGDGETGRLSLRLPISPSPAVATVEMEVEVLRLVNQAGADLGDQVTVRRTPEGQLQVQGMVETDKRKDEILRALATVTNNSAVKIKVETVAEALKQQLNAPSSPATVERLESTSNKIPADAELRRYFAAKGHAGAQLDQSVNQFANRVVNQSLQSLTHAGALNRLAQRFSIEQLRALDPEARNTWLLMLRGHAQSLQHELSGLRRELGLFIATSSSGDPQEETRIATDKDLQQAANRLFELCLANDQAVRSSLTISQNSSNVLAIKSPQFWRSLSSAETIAAKLAQLDLSR